MHMKQILAMKSQHDNELQTVYTLCDEEGRRVHEAEETIAQLHSEIASKDVEIVHLTQESERSKVILISLPYCDMTAVGIVFCEPLLVNA